jgi:hypothetical protein
MLRIPCVLLISLLAVAIQCSAALGDTAFRANITTAAEVPAPTITLQSGAPRPIPFGTANFVLNSAKTQMTMTATINNIDITGTQTADPNDNLTLAHIHASPTVTATTTAGVVWGFFGSPFNDNNPNNQTVTPFASGVGGTITGRWDAPEGNNTTLAAQISNISTQHAYINFHTTQNGPGEIRGFLVEIPEPASLMLLTMGALALAASRRKSR